MARTHQLPAVYSDNGGVLTGKGGSALASAPVRGINSLYPHAQPSDFNGAGEVVGKDGRPLDFLEVHPHAVPPVAVPELITRVENGVEVVYQRVPDVAEGKPKTQYEWRSDRTTWGRGIDAFQAMHLISAILKKQLGIELAVVLSDEEARLLPTDTRWHFKRQMVQPEPVADAPITNVEQLRVLAEQARLVPKTARTVPQSTPAPPAPVVVKPDPVPFEVFEAFVLAAMALGGEWTAAKLRDLAVENDPEIGITPTSDLRSFTARLMRLKQTGQVESLGNGKWRLAVRERSE